MNKNKRIIAEEYTNDPKVKGNGINLLQNPVTIRESRKRLREEQFIQEQLQNTDLG